MEVKVLEERKNPLLKRTELLFEVAHPGGASPRRSEVQGELAKQLKVPKERLIVESMHARFGIAQTRGEALVYATNEARDRVTREHILIRNGLKEKKSATPPTPEAAPTAPEPAAAAKPETKPEPAPEVKAEKPAEPKSEASHAPKAEKKGEKKGEKRADAKAEGKPDTKASPKPPKET
ncbi:MAG: hypothetical protein L3K13_01180 [Thermoplasmata archaeon]|nr:hypothetical protein [Thermoplasmata archaeon]